MENLDRGLVAVQEANGQVFLSWRLLGTDDPRTTFNVYRTIRYADGEKAVDYGIYQSRPDTPEGTVKLNTEPLSEATCFVDSEPALQHETTYFIRPVVDGVEGEASRSFTFAGGSEPVAYHSIPLQTPEGYTPGDASVGDLDGDGQYEVVLKQEYYPRDNSQGGVTGQTILQAYELDGTLMWSINMGKNIREGAHYTQFIVYDFDGDGRAEVACKTGDGTVDGRGKVIGDPNADWRNERGFIIHGPEYLTVFDGETGAALDTTDYVPSRHPTIADPTPEQMKEIWGDGKGNRMDRFLAGTAYLDGVHPSLIMSRGYYTRTVIAAWDFRDGKLQKRWVFDSDANDTNRPFRGQGYHSLSIADVDNDGRDEIIFGSMVIDDDGTGLYSTGWGHGDALHVSDFDPKNPGLEVMGIQERFDEEGMHFRDARTGRKLWTVPSVHAYESGGDKGEGPGRGLCIDIDPRFPGAEAWGIGAAIDGVYSSTGKRVFEHRPEGLPANFAIWWDGDLLRELLDQNFVAKWNWETSHVDILMKAHNCISNNGTKATPALSADLYGDWREEVMFRTRDNKELRIYTTTIPTTHRYVTLMHDRQYRQAIAWQNVAYNQPPHPSFAIGEGLPPPAWPDIYVTPRKK